MRPYLAVISVAAAAIAAPSATPATLAARPARPAGAATTVAYAEAPDRAARRAVTPQTPPVHDHASHDHAAPPAPSRVEPSPYATPDVTGPHQTPRRLSYGRWRTPEAAARYLAAAYTRHDDAALRRVTTPDARSQLADMRAMAPDLRLVECVDSELGFFICRFSHALNGTTKRGNAELQLNPARKQGWYADALVGCG